ncbi:hypothetical protein F2Q68_00012351 [Brassica cretica]|uniref:F-box domain-containing protein n=1 Tax=Brassica cretica TaxID=69181 RepID=A0A8S9L624_BRACR|nr:hypothetical protein F2Q68_00012351 [Brassica cretica]
MEAPSSGGWSELTVDILRYLLERLSFFDFHRAKIVCSNWYLCSKQTLRLKFRSPLLMLCPEEGGCRLYNPEEDRAYKTTSDLSGYQFLGNSETLKGGLHEIQRVGENEFKENLIKRCTLFAWDHFTIKDLRGLLWGDDKSGDYVVVWRVSNCQYLGFVRKVADGSSRLINTLVALKSSQIAVASTTQGLDPQRIDLSSVETSVSWFYKFSAAVTTASQAEALLTIL